jgi:hypothetical protein
LTGAPEPEPEPEPELEPEPEPTPCYDPPVRLLPLLLLAGNAGCAEDRVCTYDTECPVGERCVATRCVPIQLAPPRDAGPGRDSGKDAEVLPDSGPELDAGPDATVELDCALSMVSAGVVVGTTQSTADAPLIARAGLGLFGLVVRAPTGILARYIDRDGGTVLGPVGPLNEMAAQSDFGLATAVDGSLIVVWREGDDRLHGALVSDLGVQDLGFLTDVATATSSPTVARSGDEFIIAWSDRGDGTDRISTRALDDSGIPLADAVRYASPGAARLPRIADDSEAELPLVWSDEREGTSRPYVATVYSDGTVGGERELSAGELTGGVDVVETPFGVFASWIEAPPKGSVLSVHVARLEGDDLRDRVIANASGLDGRTSIAWDGDRVLVGWHRAGQNAEVTLAAVRPSLDVASTLTLAAGSAWPTLAADDDLRGVVWIDTTTSDVLYGELSCD